MEADKQEAYLEYIAKQLSILHGVLLFNDDKEYAKQKSIENTNDLYRVLNPKAAILSDVINNYNYQETIW